MKLTEIAQPTEQPGTYAGVHFSDATKGALSEFAKKNKIPKALGKEHYHTTLLYSRKHLPNYKPMGKYDSPMKGVAQEFEVWPAEPDENGKVKNCLVLKYSCPELYQRHHKLMLQHGATYDYDEYKPHVTLSYDVGKFDISKLPTFSGNLEIVEEYHEDLQTSGWADDKEKS
jgi:hypothetical protein